LAMRDCVNQTFTIVVGRQRIDLIPTYHPSAALRNLQAREGLSQTIRLVKARFPDL
jgi:uracil-DNA glycosylase